MGGVSAAIDEAARLGGVPVGRDRLPEIALLPPESGGWLRRLAHVSAASDAAGAGDDELAAGDDGAADASANANDGSLPARTVAPASLLPADARAALRLLAPFLVTGSGTGYEARMPFDLDLR